MVLYKYTKGVKKVLNPSNPLVVLEVKEIAKKRSTYEAYILENFENAPKCYNELKNNCDLSCELKATICPLSKYFKYETRFKPRRRKMREFILTQTKKAEYISYLLENLRCEERDDLEDFLESLRDDED